MQDQFTQRQLIHSIVHSPVCSFSSFSTNVTECFRCNKHTALPGTGADLTEHVPRAAGEERVSKQIGK